MPHLSKILTRDMSFSDMPLDTVRQFAVRLVNTDLYGVQTDGVNKVWKINVFFIFQRKSSLRSIGTLTPLLHITSVLGDVPRTHRVAQSGEGGCVAALKLTFLQKNMGIVTSQQTQA